MTPDPVGSEKPDDVGREIAETRARVIAGTASVQETQGFIDFLEEAIPNDNQRAGEGEDGDAGREKVAAWLYERILRERQVFGKPGEFTAKGFERLPEWTRDGWFEEADELLAALSAQRAGEPTPERKPDPPFRTLEEQLLECEDTLAAIQAEYAEFRERMLAPIKAVAGESIESMSWDDLLGVAVRNLNMGLDLGRALDDLLAAARPYLATYGTTANAVYVRASHVAAGHGAALDAARGETK